MIDDEFKLTFILGELYNKVCNCRRDYEELENNLHPAFHVEECPYRIIVEKEGIEWKEPTQQS